MQKKAPSGNQDTEMQEDPSDVLQGISRQEKQTKVPSVADSEVLYKFLREL